MLRGTKQKSNANQLTVFAAKNVRSKDCTNTWHLNCKSVRREVWLAVPTASHPPFLLFCKAILTLIAILQPCHLASADMFCKGIWWLTKQQVGHGLTAYLAKNLPPPMAKRILSYRFALLRHHLLSAENIPWTSWKGYPNKGNLNSATLFWFYLFKYLSNKKLPRILPCQKFHPS